MSAKGLGANSGLPNPYRYMLQVLGKRRFVIVPEECTDVDTVNVSHTPEVSKVLEKVVAAADHRNRLLPGKRHH